jgi:carboxynorspermidine decarboxylase
MPYRPHVIGSGLPGEKEYTCTLAGKSCLAGDVIGAYSFGAPPGKGDRLIFTDMAHYSMVKTTTFNGLALPAILRYRAAKDELEPVRAFGYEDYKGRL